MKSPGSRLGCKIKIILYCINFLSFQSRSCLVVIVFVLIHKHLYSENIALIVGAILVIHGTHTRIFLDISNQKYRINIDNYYANRLI